VRELPSQSLQLDGDGERHAKHRRTGGSSRRRRLRDRTGTRAASGPSSSDGCRSLDQGQNPHETSFQEQVSSAAVKVVGLEKSLGANKVLRGISFEAQSGQIFGLLGPNGAGKTTTLRVICTLLTPDAGSVEVLGFDTRRAAEEVRRRVGVVTAEIGVYPRLSARENISYFAQLSGVGDGDLNQKVDAVIDRLDMGSYSRQRAESLSSGQKQKVAIARAIVHDPPVLMFDEPTSNLDVLASRDIRDFMVESKERGKCVIFSTHVLHDAERLCDQVTIIHQGRVVADGPTAQVRGSRRDLEDAFLELVSRSGG
jgi:sodium transport system ATP-binding protein